MMDRSSHRPNSTYDRIKRIMDLGCALALSVTLMPTLLAIGLLIWLDDGRPILFSQMRVGRGGTLFRLYKFRTLPTDAPATVQAEDATRIGRLLRRWALDELPQLWNILRGEMSLVGPRPILPEEATHYTPRQRQRLSVRPGLTGWAQIHGRNALPWHERIKYDLCYVQNRSLGLDLRILLRTPGVLLDGNGVYGPGNDDPDAEDFAAHRLRSVEPRR